MRKYDTVIFDLDGTLLNTLEDLADAVNFVMRANAFPERTYEEVRKFVGNGIRKLMERAVPEGIDAEAFEKVFEEFRSYYTGHCQNKTKAYEGIEMLLRELSADGVSMAIVSNKNQAAVTALNDLYFSKYIKTAIGQREGMNRKPSPDAVFLALRTLGKEHSRALYVGDSDVDFTTAKNSGMDCALVTWGFRTKEELKECTPLVFADDAVQLLEWIRDEKDDRTGKIL